MRFIRKIGLSTDVSWSVPGSWSGFQPYSSRESQCWSTFIEFSGFLSFVPRSKIHASFGFTSWSSKYNTLFFLDRGVRCIGNTEKDLMSTAL